MAYQNESRKRKNTIGSVVFGSKKIDCYENVQTATKKTTFSYQSIRVESFESMLLLLFFFCAQITVHRFNGIFSPMKLVPRIKHSSSVQLFQLHAARAFFRFSLVGYATQVVGYALFVRMGWAVWSFHIFVRINAMCNQDSIDLNKLKMHAMQIDIAIDNADRRQSIYSIRHSYI